MSLNHLCLRGPLATVPFASCASPASWLSSDRAPTRTAGAASVFQGFAAFHSSFCWNFPLVQNFIAALQAPSAACEEKSLTEKLCSAIHLGYYFFFKHLLKTSGCKKQVAVISLHIYVCVLIAFLDFNPIWQKCPRYDAFINTHKWIPVRFCKLAPSRSASVIQQ